jgi:hypothetical protein
MVGKVGIERDAVAELELVGGAVAMQDDPP